MNSKLGRVVARGLMAFVLVSIGYAVGNEVGRRSVVPEAPAEPAAETARVVVHYFHATKRCTTCNAIERMTRETLENEFAVELRDGLVRWRVENFQENEPLAERYGVASSTVVLARYQDGDEVDSERLDQVWEFVHEPVMFRDYIRYAVQEMLEAEGG